MSKPPVWVENILIGAVILGVVVGYLMIRETLWYEIVKPVLVTLTVH